jgi:hypothetical protein
MVQIQSYFGAVGEWLYPKNLVRISFGERFTEELGTNFHPKKLEVFHALSYN